MDWTDTEFLRPLVSAWLGKIETAYKNEHRKHFVEVAEECKMFYARSCAALWNSKWASRFLNNVISRPRFPISVNKAFELVAVIGPNVLWDIPFRKVMPKQRLAIDDDTIEQLMRNPEIAGELQMRMQHDQYNVAMADVVAELLEKWLNYTSREMPGGGMTQHSQAMAIDAMLTGRGVRFIETYQYPGSDRSIVGSFRSDPLDLLIDPDVKDINEAKWIMRTHREPYWEVEKRFGLPSESLKDKSSLESAWNYSESVFGTYDSTAQPRLEEERDIVVWHEIWSKMGPGSRMVRHMDTGLREHLERVVGDYAYIAIASNVPWPLNCPSEKMRGGMTDEEVRQAFSWPTPLWADDRWPCEVCDFYPNPDSAYPVAPLEPGMGYLKFLNLMLPFLAQRTWSSSRDFWAVLGSHMERYEEYINNGKDQCIIPVDPTSDDVRKAISIIQQPPVNIDAWKITDVMAEWFERATGLSAFQYGMKAGEANDRSAAETQARARAAGVRPQYMQKRIAETESRIASTEAFLSRWFIDGRDVEPLGGMTFRFLWEKFVMSADVELVVRQMAYTISSSSLQRPDRERDMMIWDRMIQVLGPQYFQYAMATGEFTGWNTLVEAWAENLDAARDRIDGLLLSPPQPDPEAQQAQQQQVALEQQKAQMELAAKQMDLQGKQLDIQGKQVSVEGEVAKTLLEQRVAAMEAAAAERKAEIEIAKASAALDAASRKHAMDLLSKQTSAKIDIAKKLSE